MLHFGNICMSVHKKWANFQYVHTNCLLCHMQVKTWWAVDELSDNTWYDLKAIAEVFVCGIWRCSVCLVISRELQLRVYNISLNIDRIWQSWKWHKWSARLFFKAIHQMSSSLMIQIAKWKLFYSYKLALNPSHLGSRISLANLTSPMPADALGKHCFLKHQQAWY